MPGTPPTRFVYLGPEGTFAEQALRTLPAAERGTRTPARSVPEALDAVRAGDADAALVPLENSIGGAVGVTLDEMVAGDPLVITREVVLPVEFVLARGPGSRWPASRTVAAHPQASTQCRGWLRDNLPDAVVVDVLSNAAAAVSAAARRSTTRRSARRSAPPVTGSPSWPRRSPTTATPSPGSRWCPGPARRRHRPATTSPRSRSTSATTGSARCWPCSPSWRYAAST